MLLFHRLEVSAVLLVASFLLTVGCQQKPKAEPITAPDYVSAESEKVLSDTKRLIDATLNQEIDPLLELTHPNTLKMMGGKEKARELMQLIFDQVTALQLNYDRFVPVGEPKFYRTPQYEFAVIATEAHATFPDDSLDQKGAMVGMRKVGSDKWTYVDYNDQTKDQIYTILPELPRNIELPETLSKLGSQ
ncbi:hypothetical protein AB1L30_25950 [Bremerella sp. JC817]|uniref:hypothetical protein n=1 Tax=Bremerella sp. JC817 TaxID=3231756 RepID=UPI00345A2769